MSLAEVGREAGSTGRKWHLFRHTFASLRAQVNVSSRKLQDWLGHADPRTTEMYLRLAAGYDPDVELPAATAKT